MSTRLVSRGRGLGVLGGSLLASCLGLAVVLAVQLSTPRPEVATDSASPPETAPTEGAVAAAPAAATLALEPLDKFREVVERPVFHASRRPVPQDADDAPAVAAVELRNLTLIGILISPETKLAIFHDKSAQALRLEAGATVGKWSVAEVRADGVTLRRGGETHVIPLHKVESAHWSSGDGKNQPTTAQVRDRDPAKIKTQKAPTREQRSAQQAPQHLTDCIFVTNSPDQRAMMKTGIRATAVPWFAAGALWCAGCTSVPPQTPTASSNPTAVFGNPVSRPPVPATGAQDAERIAPAVPPRPRPPPAELYPATSTYVDGKAASRGAQAVAEDGQIRLELQGSGSQ